MQCGSLNQTSDNFTSTLKKKGIYLDISSLSNYVFHTIWMYMQWNQVANTGTQVFELIDWNLFLQGAITQFGGDSTTVQDNPYV